LCTYTSPKALEKIGLNLKHGSSASICAKDVEVLGERLYQRLSFRTGAPKPMGMTNGAVPDLADVPL
jgi:hypothetical protein